MASPAKSKSSDTGAVVGNASGPRASAQLTTFFTGAQQQQAKEILDDIGDDIELQLIVKMCIANYRGEKAEAEANQVTIRDMVANTVASRKRKREEEEEEEEEEEKVADMDESKITGVFSRGQFVFAKWGHARLNLLLGFLDKCMDKHVLKALKLEAKREALEAGLELRMFGGELDRVGSTSIKEVFDASKRVYIQLGARFQHFMVDFEQGIILWDHCGPWSMKRQAGSTVELVLKKWAIPGATVDFELGLDENYLMDDEGPFELHMAFSVRQANLVSASTGESYLLATMVPQLRRKLTRRPSEAEGAVNLMRKTMATAEEENKLKKQAKAKAKIGVRALRQEKPADNSMEVDGSASKGDREVQCTANADEVEK